jgi:molecular chaperone GrpE
VTTEEQVARKKGGAGEKSDAEELEASQEAAQQAEVEQEPADELTELRERLEQAEAEAAEYLDGWQRARAEFANYKKRQEVERSRMVALANGELLRKMLPLVDDFERARETLPVNLSRLTWCEGFFLMRLKLDGILESEGVKPIEAVGQPFDPVYHEAVSYEEAPGHEEGEVVGEIQRGYMLGDRVLRPSLVRVAKAPFAKPKEETNEESESEE